MDRAHLKAMAKEQISGKIGILFLITLIVSAISGLLNAIPAVGSVASLLVTPAFSLSLLLIYLNIVNNNLTPTVNDAFQGFNDWWSAFKVYFLTSILTALWTLLFIIPGIIKSIEYSMAMYILAENPGKSARECIEESKAMTYGHRMELFMLSLSFIGWALLCGITFGIAGIWVIPYMNATFTNAYNSLKAPVVDGEATETL